MGANIGDTVLTAAGLVGSSGQVIGLEPHPRTFQFLQENLKLNRVENVQAIHSAAGDRLGEVSFSSDRRDDMNKVAPGPLQVPVSPLDTLIPGRESIALLKVDVEGYEKFVLMGATQILEMTECLYFEIGLQHFQNYDYTIQSLLQLVQNKGFQLFRIVENGLIQRITPNYTTNSVENLMGIRNEKTFLDRTGWKITV